jgi:hypothetical protein
MTGSTACIIRLLRERFQAKDVLAQQQKVAPAEALALVAPVHFLSFAPTWRRATPPSVVDTSVLLIL